MRLILVRHGETVENRKKIMQGHYDGKLSDLGKEQAKLAAERLKDEKIDYIFASDSSRAVDTARYIAGYHTEANFEKDDLLRERCKGVLEGKRWEDLEPDLQKPEWFDTIDQAPPGGETVRQLYKRVEKFYRKLERDHMDDTVLVVAHGGSVRMLLWLAMEKRIEEAKKRGKLGNASVTIINVNPDGYEIECENCELHL